MLWQVHSQNKGLQRELIEGLSLSPTAAQVLLNRGIKGVNEAKLFLYPTLNQLHDPFLMADMEKGAERICQAIQKKEKITIFGDYDADGVTSTALFLKFLDDLGVGATYYVPNRVTEGYGINKKAIGEIARLGADVVITVDNGIGAIEEAAYAKSLGLTLIITDHHEPKDDLPDAFAVINPKRSDSKFPFRDLAGVGVAFNLIIAIRQKLRNAGFFANRPEPKLRDYLGIVAIGTVADVVPLVDENRIFVKFGIDEIKKSANLGINALKVVSGIDKNGTINATSVAFRLAPRINAAGRIGDQFLGVRLLITKDAEEALSIAQTLNELNSKRQSIEAAILKDTEKMLADYNDKDLGLVLYKEDWHVGVVGIAAARVAESQRKPAILIAKTPLGARGSVRSIGEYNVVAALAELKHLLVNYGGHRHAAGITIKPDKIKEFQKEFAKYVSSTLTDADRKGRMDIDCQISSFDITEELIKELELLEPFGEGNKEPVFCMRDIKVADARTVADKHLKLKIKDNMVTMEAIGFGMAKEEVNTLSVLDVAFVPQRDDWKGGGAIQLKLKGIKAV